MTMWNVKLILRILQTSTMGVKLSRKIWKINLSADLYAVLEPRYLQCWCFKDGLHKPSYTRGNKYTITSHVARKLQRSCTNKCHCNNFPKTRMRETNVQAHMNQFVRDMRNWSYDFIFAPQALNFCGRSPEPWTLSCTTWTLSPAREMCSLQPAFKQKNLELQAPSVKFKIFTPKPWNWNPNFKALSL